LVADLNPMMISLVVAALLVALTVIWVRCNTSPSPPPKKEAGDPVAITDEIPFIKFSLGEEWVWSMQRLFHIAVALVLVLHLVIGNRTAAQQLAETPRFWIAIIVGLLSGWLRLTAFRALGKRFTFQLGVKRGAELKTDGLYGLVRHPSYTGALGINFAFASVVSQAQSVLSPLAFGSELIGQAVNLAIWSFPCVVALFLVRRIPIEEQMLRNHFRTRYEDYQRRTWRLIPFIY
jgi:protein-S-isoprenylcysteine O-methyltransferase Ste14